MTNYNALKETIKSIAKDTFDGMVPGGYTRARLIEIEPELKFELTNKLLIYGQFLVTPRYKVFREEDLNKEFVFFKDSGGQTYYYVYEMKWPQGKNGEPYHWEGEIVSATLYGTCPDGEVIVTHGEIHEAIHEKQVGQPRYPYGLIRGIE